LRYRIPNYAVLDLAKTAAAAINVYAKEHDRQPMTAALNKILKTTGTDKLNPLVLNYQAILEYLLGKYDQSLEHLNQQLKNSEISNNKIFDEIKVNIGVVRYHQLYRDLISYGIMPDQRKKIEEIVSLIFPGVVRPRLIFPPKGDVIWFAERESITARLFTLGCIPATDGKALRESAGESADLMSSYAKAIEHAQEVLQLKRPSRLSPKEQDGWRQARARAHNARGRAEMYHTDHFYYLGKKLPRLQAALKDLEWATSEFTNEISYKCDVAACHMRLGYWWAQSEALDVQHDLDAGATFEAESPEAVASETEFKMAEEQLKNIVEQHFPENGYGLFELGRVYRLLGRFNEAEKQLEQSLKIPENERGFSIPRVQREVELTKEKSLIYP
jgi:tetratricopeptide (TPR) repeat protein